MSIAIIVNTKRMIRIMITLEGNVVDANPMGFAKMKSGKTMVIIMMITDTSIKISIGNIMKPINTIKIMVVLANVVDMTTEMFGTLETRENKTDTLISK
jgi:hypothetical protein